MSFLGRLLNFNPRGSTAVVSRRTFLAQAAAVALAGCAPRPDPRPLAQDSSLQIASETIKLLKDRKLAEIKEINHLIKSDKPKFYFLQVDYTHPIPGLSTEEQDKESQRQVYRALNELSTAELQGVPLYVDKLDRDSLLELNRQLSYYSNKLPEATISESSLKKDQSEFAARALAAEGQYQVKAAAEDSYLKTLLSVYSQENILSKVEADNFSKLRQALEISKLIEPSEELGAARIYLPFMILGIRLGLNDGQRMMKTIGRDLDSLPAYLLDLAAIELKPPTDLEAAIVKAHNSQRLQRQTRLLKRIISSNDRVNLGLFTPDVDFTAAINQWNHDNPGRQIDYLRMTPQAITSENYQAADIDHFAKEAARVVEIYRSFACEYIKSQLLRSPLESPPKPKPAPRIVPGTLVAVNNYPEPKPLV